MITPEIAGLLLSAITAGIAIGLGIAPRAEKCRRGCCVPLPDAGLPPSRPHNMMTPPIRLTSHGPIPPLAKPNPAAHNHGNGYRGECCEDAEDEVRREAEKKLREFYNE